MSLRRKLLFKDAALLVSLSLMITGALWGLLRQRKHVEASLKEYSALHQVEASQARLVAFSQSLHAGQTLGPQALEDLRAASLRLREYKATVSQYEGVLPPEISPDQQQRVKTQTKHLVAGLVKLVAEVDGQKKQPLDEKKISGEVDAVSREMAELLEMCNDFVHRTELESQKDLHLAIVGVSSIAAATLLGAVLASLWQYRRIMIPLRRLGEWCRRTADGDFSITYQATSDREFAELGRDVNRMAQALGLFTQKMEALVASKSRELVRSERLASVGYLAAGVAHEINNPLNIMSGYAELTIKRLRRSAPDAADSEVIQHLSIIRNEAFRCKEITQKLLSLAKGGDETREAVSICQAIADVVTLVRGLKGMRNRKLDITVPSEDQLLVSANTTEIKQVLLNLIINAIEAVADSTGRIRVEAVRSANWVEICVTDNGRGMSAQTLDHVFEPFFTNKRGAGDPGTGLGLSITHAIVTHHHGELHAESEGLQRGSRFTVRLPARPSAIASIQPASASPALIS